MAELLGEVDDGLAEVGLSNSPDTGSNSALGDGRTSNDRTGNGAGGNNAGAAGSGSATENTATNNSGGAGNTGAAREHSRETAPGDDARSNSLFDRGTRKPEGTPVQAEGTQGASQGAQPRAVDLKDDDLVPFNGEMVPFGKIKGGTVLKHDYDKLVDKTRAEVRAEREQLAKRSAVVEAAAPQVNALLGDPFGRVYAESLLATGNPERARRSAEAAVGVGEAAKPVAVDPRLVPPKDEQTGESLPEDDPRFIRWATLTRAEAIGEAAAERRFNELDRARAGREAEAKAQRDAESRKREDAAQFRTNVQTENLRVLRTLPGLLRARGVDVGAMTDADWATARNAVAEAAKPYNIDLRSDEYLAENLLTEGILAAVVDGGAVAGKLKPAASGNGGGKGPLRVGDTLTAQEIEEMERQRAEREAQMKTGKLAAYNRPKPLNAGGLSETMPSRESGYAHEDAESGLRDMNEELGIT